MPKGTGEERVVYNIQTLCCRQILHNQRVSTHSKVRLLKLDHVSDVTMSPFLLTQDQYLFTFNTVVEFLDSFDQYANFD